MLGVWLKYPVENGGFSCKLFFSKLSIGYKSTSFAKCIPTANISEHNSRKGYKTLGNVFSKFPSSNARWFKALKNTWLGAL